MKEEKEEPKKKRTGEIDLSDLAPKKDPQGGTAKPAPAKDGKVIQQERAAPFFHS